MPLWQDPRFIQLTRTANDATDYFRIPTDRVVEVGTQISENQERDVLTDVVKDAVGQAVTQALRKLQIGPMVPPKDPPRRRKK